MIIDKCNPEVGTVQLIVDGDVVFEKKNTVVNSSRTIKASMAIGGNNADRIASMKVGLANHAEPPPVLETEASLSFVVSTMQIGASIEPRPYVEDDPANRALSSVVTWTAILPVDEEIEFDEAGLFSEREYMWSRVTFQKRTKPAGVSMAIRWKMEF